MDPGEIPFGEYEERFKAFSAIKMEALAKRDGVQGADRQGKKRRCD